MTATSYGILKRYTNILIIDIFIRELIGTVR